MLTIMSKTLQRSMNQSVGRMFNEPHEKFMAIVLIVLVYSVIYYMVYKSSTTATHILNKENEHFENTKNKETSLSFGHFVWYSCMVNFTMPFGDIFPKSSFAKALCVSQASLVWIVMLSY